MLYDSTQGIHAVKKEMASRFGLPVGKVQVICHHMGGGFGAKQKPWKQAIFAALLAKRCGRPVQIFLDRESENLAAGLASELDMDPMDLRLLNIATEDQTQDLPWSSPQALRRCHERAGEVFGWQGRKKVSSHSSVKHGFGMASHEWMAGAGKPPGHARIVIESDGSCQLLLGTQDIGTGTRTVLGQVAAEALGVDVDKVEVSLGDTISGLPAPTSAGSFTVPTMAPAVQEAAIHAQLQLREAAAAWWQCEVSDVSIVDGVLYGKAGSGHKASLAELMDELSGMVIQGYGTRQANTTKTSIRPFGVQCAEVSVDVSTGEITVVRIVSAPDCGRVINPLLAATQQIRNRATVAGNLMQAPRCWYYPHPDADCWRKGGDQCPARQGQNQHHAIVDSGPCVAVHPSDLATCLVALDASVDLRTRHGNRTVKVADFLVAPTDGHRTETILKPDEIITAISIPSLNASSRSCYLKAMDRKAWAFALIGVAAVVHLQDNRISEVRLCLSGVANTPFRLTGVESLLKGHEPSTSVVEDAASLATERFIALSNNGYKIDLVRGLVKAALEKLLLSDS